MERLADLVSSCIQQVCGELPSDVRISFPIPGTCLLASYSNLAAGNVEDVALLHCKRSAAGYALRNGPIVRAKETWQMSAWADAGATFPNGPGTICALHVPAIESGSMDKTPCTAVLTIAWPKVMDKADLDRWAAALAPTVQEVAGMESSCRADLAAEWAVFGWTPVSGPAPVPPEKRLPTDHETSPASDDHASSPAVGSTGASSSTGSRIVSDSVKPGTPRSAEEEDLLGLHPAGLCFKDPEMERRYRIYSAQRLIWVDLWIQLVFILMSAYALRARDNPIRLGIWFRVNFPCGYIQCALQTLCASMLPFLMLYQKDWYCKHREALILVRNSVLLFLSGCLTVRYSGAYEADVDAPIKSVALYFIVGLPIVQLIERITMRIRCCTAHAIVAHLVFLVLCMSHVHDLCHFHNSWMAPQLCTMTAWAIHVVAMFVVPAFINVTIERRDRAAFIKSLAFRPTRGGLTHVPGPVLPGGVLTRAPDSVPPRGSFPGIPSET